MKYFHTNNGVGIGMHKTKLIRKKLSYIGMMIPDNSKMLMYDFFYRLQNNTAQGVSCCTQTWTAFCFRSKWMTSTKTLNQTKICMIQLTTQKRISFKCQQMSFKHVWCAIHHDTAFRQVQVDVFFSISVACGIKLDKEEKCAFQGPSLRFDPEVYPCVSAF